MKLTTIASCALALMPVLRAQPTNKQKQLAKPNIRQGPPPIPKKPATPAQIPDAQLNRLMNMTPGEREQFLANLPSERRAGLEQRLSRLDALTPEQRGELSRRFQEFQKLRPVRRQAIRDELQTLRKLKPVERRARVNSPEFRELYSPEENRLMRDVFNLP